VTGTAGTPIVAALLKNPQFTITALTRADSTASMPTGVQVAKIDYADTSSITAAMKGQDMLIITMSVHAPKETQYQLIDAAIAAGVSWILPNTYGQEVTEAAGRDTYLGPPMRAVQQYIEEKAEGKTSWIGIACGFWYEFSLVGMYERFGFDLKEKRATLYDEGEVPLSTSTWAQLGRVVAALLSLPVERLGGEKAVLSDWKNKYVHFDSFCVTQKQMLESLQRVKPEWQWKVDKIPSKKFYAEGLEQLQKGDRIGFSKMLYSRMFYPEDQPGNAVKHFGLDNEKLGVPEEDLDEATKGAVEMWKKGVFEVTYN